MFHRLPEQGRTAIEPRFQALRHVFLLGYSVVIGLLAGAGALVFRLLIEIFQKIFWGSTGPLEPVAAASPWWMILGLPALGGLIAGPLITYLAPEAKGPGVPEVIAAVAIRQGRIRHRVTFLKALISSLLIGAGASVGREGPIVQIGASVGSSLAQLAGLGPELRRALLAAGAAAGIGATFNAPIAGTLFAMEIILMDLEVAYISHIIIAAVSGSFFARFFWGEFPHLAVEGFRLAHYWELGAYLLLGLAAGGLAVVFNRLLFLADRAFNGSPLPEWLRPAVGGLLLGLLALALPQVLGVGYGTVNLGLAGTLGLGAAALLLAGKLLATTFCVGSGMSGGIFAPSVVIGAALGTTVALGLNTLWPGLALTPANYALAGMGALVAGTTLAPITAILTVFEMSSNYAVIFPMMVAAISATLVVRLTLGYSVYEMKLLARGIRLERGMDTKLLEDMQVHEAMRRDFESVRESTPLAQLIEQVEKSAYPHFVVLNQAGRLAGVLTLTDLAPVLGHAAELNQLLVAADLMTREVVTVTTRDSLDTAWRLFEDRDLSFMPVVDPTGFGRVAGILREHDLHQARRERHLKNRLLSGKGG
ncbi:MAG: chloride channel protein [Deltaproteobacteria bacterium]|nr:chloride channel protein [Deltaproteobacteria bacterium]